MRVRHNVSRIATTLQPNANHQSSAFGQSSETNPSEESIYYRASPRRILHILRSKVDKLSDATTLASFPSLVKQILRNGLDEDILDAYKAAMVDVEDEKVQQKKQEELVKRQKIAEQARTRVACEIVGGYLAPDVHQCLVRRYE